MRLATLSFFGKSLFMPYPPCMCGGEINPHLVCLGSSRVLSTRRSTCCSHHDHCTSRCTVIMFSPRSLYLTLHGHCVLTTIIVPHVARSLCSHHDHCTSRCTIIMLMDCTSRFTVDSHSVLLQGKIILSHHRFQHQLHCTE